MIVPINTGRSIIPVYIPTTSTIHTASDQSTNNANAGVNLSSPWTWVSCSILIVFVICTLAICIKTLKEFGGKQ